MDPQFIEQLYQEVEDRLEDKQEAFIVGFLSALRSIASGCEGIRDELQQAYGVELVDAEEDDDDGD